MTIEQLEKQLQSEQLQSVYLLYGPETFLLESDLKKIKKIFGQLLQGINYVQLDETNVGGIISDIETPAFGFNKKLIVARNTGLFKKEGKKKDSQLGALSEKVSKYIQDNKKVIDESVVIVFIEDEVDKNKLYKTIDEYKNVVEYAIQKPMQIAGRLRAISYAYKVHIDDRTMQYLMECSGTNMQDLINEMRKLIEYVDEGGTITTKEVDLLATKQIEAIIFDLTDNLGKKNISKAMEVLKGLEYNKEPVQKILIVLYGHFRKLYITKVAERERKDAAQYLNLKPNQTFLINKYKTQARAFKEKELYDILKELIQLDTNSKIGLIDIDIGLESVLCRYCS